MNRPPAWSWQTRGIAEVMHLLNQGELSICVTSPTGMGKGRMIEDLVVQFLDRGGRCILFTDRKMLTKQTGERFRESGIHFGYASAEHGMDTRQNVIIASLQTVKSRIKRQVMELPAADLVVIDEAHKRGFDYVIEEYRNRNHGVSIVGFTATPVGLKGKYSHLVIAGDKPEGRSQGALVPCRVVAPSEPDMKGVRMNKVGEYEHKGMVKRVMQCTVFADIFDTWLQLGKYRPTFVWAPGVPESLWIRDEFRRRGVQCEHIDGKTEEKDRDRIRTASRNGSVRVVSSCGVLREGVDWPWISYGILVQVCGAYETFVQIVGRILRAFPGKHDAILQDHSGTWWRHGSPNFDRLWSLDDTNQSIAEERRKKLEKSEEDSEAPTEAEPICCQQCHGIRIGGSKCPHCGFASPASVRMIRKEDGTLVAMKDDDAKPKKNRSFLNKHWTSVLFRCGSTGRTFNQAAGLFFKEVGKWPQTTPDCFPKPKLGSEGWDTRIDLVYPAYNRRRR